MKEKITIKDVAKYANVSVATVSRVMNNKGYVYEDTRRTVLKAIEELNFEPNLLARSLTNRHTDMIGVIVPHLGTNFYGKLIDGIEEKALENHLKTMIFNVQNNEEREREYIKIIEQYNIEGLIVASNCYHPEDILALNLPVVSVDHTLNEETPSVSSNNFDGGKLTALKFKDSGCKNILLLRGPSFLLTQKERSDGFLSVFEGDNSVHISTIDSDLLNPYVDKIDEFISNNPVDAIFAFSDTLALAAMNSLARHNKKIPEDVQIIGFDNDAFTNWTTPAITTVSQSIEKIGNIALETLHKLITDEEVSEKHVKVDVTMIERQTTK